MDNADIDPLGKWPFPTSHRQSNGETISFAVRIAEMQESHRKTWLVRIHRSDYVPKDKFDETGVMTVLQTENQEDAETERDAWDSFLTGKHPVRTVDLIAERLARYRASLKRQANTLYLECTNEKGEIAARMTRSTFKPLQDEQIMTAALELSDAVELRNVNFGEHKIGSLVVRPVTCKCDERSTLDDNESNPITLWAEIHRLRAMIKGPPGFDTWQDAAIDERVRRVAAEQTLGSVTEMSLCETSQLHLRPDQLYRFKVMDGCAACAAENVYKDYEPREQSNDQA